MTTIPEEAPHRTVNPIAHLTPDDIEQIGHELDAIRQYVIDTRGESDARYIRRVITTQRPLELGSRVVLLGSALPAGVGRRHRRPQSSPRSSRTWRSGTTSCTASGTGCATRRSTRPPGSGTSATPGRAVEALPQRAAPQLHQRDRQGQRPRLRHHARRRGPALAPDVPRPAAVELRQRLLLRVRHRGVRPRARRGTIARKRPRTRSSSASVKAVLAKIRRQVTKDYVVHPTLSLPYRLVLPDAGRELHRQHGAQPVVALGDHVRPLPRGRRRPSRSARSTARPAASGTCARCSARPTSPARSCHAHHDRQPVAPDRAPPVPRPAVATGTARSRRR